MCNIFIHIGCCLVVLLLRKTNKTTTGTHRLTSKSFSCNAYSCLIVASNFTSDNSYNASITVLYYNNALDTKYNAISAWLYT